MRARLAILFPMQVLRSLGMGGGAGSENDIDQLIKSAKAEAVGPSYRTVKFSGIAWRVGALTIPLLL